MTFTVNSYACFGPHTALKPYKLERRDLFDDDVQIEVMYTGVCHTDVHIANNDWGGAVYPMVSGHEIVGKVVKTGSKVTKHKVGDVVAVGCLVDSCRKCEACETNEERFCFNGCTEAYNYPEPRFPGHTTAGGYSEQIVIPEHFTLKVPKSLQKSELISGVAPILCAGITMYSPMREHNLQAGQRVGIVGLGGLGLMGVKLGKVLGAEVVVISRSHKKDAEAKRIGATEVIASSDEAELKKHERTFDLIIDTIPFDHDVNIYTPLLKLHKTLVVVGHVGFFKNPGVSTLPLINGNRRIAGSAIGGIKQTQELLELCGEHGIVADHKVITMNEVDEAWKDIGGQALRYVIDINQFRESNKKSST